MPHYIRDQPIFRPIPSADYIACPGRSEQSAVWRTKKALTVTLYNELSSGLRRTVWVTASELIILPVSPGPFPVLVHLVGRNCHNRLCRAQVPARVENVSGTQY